MSKKNERFVVVTTDKDRRGVFGGVLEFHDPETGRAALTEARMCVYWPDGGVVGLAATGPVGKGFRITKAAPRIELDGVTCVMDTTDAARDAWRAEPWS